MGFNSWSKAAGFFGMTFGALSFSGQFFHIPYFLDVLRGVTPDTSIALFIAGTSILLYPQEGLLARLAAGLSGATVAFLGFLRLIEHNFSVDLVSSAPAIASSSLPLTSDRMSVVTAGLVALLGSALVLNAFGRRRLANAVSLILLFTGFSLVLLQLYGLDGFLTIGIIELFFPRTVLNPLAIVIMTTGLLSLLSTVEPTRLVTSNTPGGAMLRRLFPYVVGVPVGLAWVKTLGLRSNLLSVDMSFFVLVLSSVLFLSVLLLITAKSINRSETKRAWANEKRKEMSDIKSAILRSAIDGVITFDHDGQIQEFNPAAEGMFRCPREAAIGKKIDGLIALPGLRDSGEARLPTHLSKEINPVVGRTVEMRAMRVDGSGFPVEVLIIKLGIPDPPRFTMFVRDITGRKEAEAEILRSRSELETRVLERTEELANINERLQILREIAIAAGSAKCLNESYEIILQRVCERHEFVIGQAWIPNEEASLQCISWYSEIPGADEFRLASLDQTFRMSCDLPGAAWSLKAPYWSEDLANDATFTRTEFASKLGIESGMAVPLVADEKIVAVMEFYSLGRRKRDDLAVGFIMDVVTEVAGTLLRKQREEELRQRELDLQRIERSASVGTWRWQAQTDHLITSEEFRLLHGMNGNAPSTRRDFLEVVLPEDRQAVERTLDSALKTGIDVSCEYRIVSNKARNPTLMLRGHVEHDESGLPLSLTGIVLDVTELRCMREKAAEKENALQDMIDGIKDYAIYMLDSKGMILSWNPGARHIYGYWPDEVMNKHWSVLFPESERREIEGRLHAAVELGRFETEGRRKRKDGRSFIGHSIVTPTLDERGSIHGFTAVTRDVTERRIAEKELHERDVQLIAAQEIAKLGSWEWTILEDRMTYSPELCRIIGHTPEDSLDAFLAVVHEADREKSLSQIQSLLKMHKPFDFEQRVVRPDGTCRLLHTQGRIMLDESGDGDRVIAVCHDVTDVRRAEKQFQDLLEVAPEAMIITNQEGDIVIVNARAEELFGFSRQDLIGRSAEILLPGRFRGGKEPNYLMKPCLPTTERRELFGLRKNNSEFPVEVSTSLLEMEDGNMMTFSAIRDVSEPKRLQAMIDETNRLRLEDLRKFAGFIQEAQEEERRRIARELHDGICQRLSGMKLIAEVVENDLLGKDRKLSRSMKNLSRQFESLIDEARRMAANLRPSVFDDFGLAVAVKLLARDFERSYGIHPILNLDENARLAPALEINLYRIVQEALSNIGKHTEASRVEIILGKEGDFIHLRISDNGTGFERQAMLHGSEQSGHGLINMQERAKLTGGDFFVDSVPGRGTTISVTIPLVDGSTEGTRDNSMTEASS